MDNIFEPNNKFDFSKITLGQPQVIQSSNYFTKLLFENKEFFLQFPKCKTKQGIIQNEKKMHADLLYESFTHPELSEWVESLEETCQKLIYNKRNIWFTDNIELNDIESAFNNVIKYQKNGKQMIIRCYISKPQSIKLSPLCVVYDENEKKLSVNDVTYEKDIIPLVKLEGIRFSSRNFQIELNLVQVMVLKEQDKQCLIKIKNDNNIFNNIEEDEINNNTEEIINTSSNNETNTLINNPSVLNSENKKIDVSSNIEKLYTNQNEQNNESNKNEKNYNYEQNNIYQNKYQENKEQQNNENNYYTLELNENENIKEYNSDILDNSHCLEIVDLDLNKITETVKLKKPNEIYYEIYRAAREKAKLAKKLAIEACLDAKKIKTKYMLDDLDESDDEISIIENL